ncbi:paralemmin-3 isoform X2 [Corythoichthys intestinalis]|nr:paralemmin-3 isoform X2 [Corythoichthys intestinalis]XP_057698357.1 paralemmin-3 isoform X2 [Corythoichthys intestinalis]
MDEAEKYQQRLEAIAEKRRLQEEQERAKREMEDEKLRLQQLKRKSLRDQWLMEGAPLSLSSMDSQSPDASSLASQEVGKHRLLSQNVGFAGNDEKEQTTEDQTEAAGMEAGDMDAVLQNTDIKTRSGTLKDDMNPIQISREEPPSVLLNGEGDFKSSFKHQSDETLEKSTTNGPRVTVTVEYHSQHIPHLSCTKVDEGVTVMRAKRVVLLDDDKVALQKHQKSTTEDEGTVKVQITPEASTQSAEEETSATEETKDLGNVEASGPVEDVLVAPVPVYAESQPSCPASKEPHAQKEEEAITAASEVSETTSKAQGDAVATSPQFQEVTLNDHLENNRTEVRPPEMEPFLEEASGVPDEAATEKPAGAAQAPRKKTFQCCSVM